MIEYVRGNLLEAEADALVNTVNTQGVMGKGIALQFKKAFPSNYNDYAKACKKGEVKLGKMFVFDRATFERPRFIINFPTKEHWKQRSRLENIQSGLKDLVANVRALEIHSIAVPPLGSGLGGLSWAQVRPLIEKAFASETNVKVMVYEPAGAPAAEAMPNRTAIPDLTTGRAAVLGLMKRYLMLDYDGYRLSLLEVQKLAYFLQEAGQPLKLDFVKHTYGPYASKLRHVLNALEGHYIRGFGDGSSKPETPIHLMPLADQALDIVAANPEMRERFTRVARLIEGFEFPYGMELLSTVHWIATREFGSRISDTEKIVKAVHAWSSRKAKLMLPKHIHVALDRLQNEDWVYR